MFTCRGWRHIMILFSTIIEMLDPLLTLDDTGTACFTQSGKPPTNSSFFPILVSAPSFLKKTSSGSVSAADFAEREENPAVVICFDAYAQECSPMFKAVKPTISSCPLWVNLSFHGFHGRSRRGIGTTLKPRPTAMIEFHSIFRH